jgi:hypothetical protein
VWQPVAAFAAGAAVGAALPALLLAARDACFGAGLGLRATAFLSLLAANGAALAGGALVAWIAGRHEIVVAASSVACGLAVVVVAVSVGSGEENEQGRLVRAYAMGFATPFVMFALLGAGLVTF